MDMPQGGAAGNLPGRAFLPAALVLAVAVLIWAALPATQGSPISGPTPAGPADPDLGFWVELAAVAIVTGLAGLFLHLRRPPEA